MGSVGSNLHTFLLDLSTDLLNKEYMALPCMESDNWSMKVSTINTNCCFITGCFIPLTGKASDWMCNPIASSLSATIFPGPVNPCRQTKQSPRMQASEGCQSLPPPPPACQRNKWDGEWQAGDVLLWASNSYHRELPTHSTIPSCGTGSMWRKEWS